MIVASFFPVIEGYICFFYYCSPMIIGFIIGHGCDLIRQAGTPASFSNQAKQLLAKALADASRHESAAVLRAVG
jgi:hypothetical protein